MLTAKKLRSQPGQERLANSVQRPDSSHFHTSNSLNGEILIRPFKVSNSKWTRVVESPNEVVLIMVWASSRTKLIPLVTTGKSFRTS